MRKTFTVIIFTVVVLLIGRSLTFLPRLTLFSNLKTETLALKNQIKEFIGKQKGNYSVYFSDLDNTNLSFGLNEHEVYIAASLNKPPIIAVLYYLAKENKLDLSEKITIQEDDIQDYGTGTIRYEEPGAVYSFKTLAKLSLQKSDNTAAHVLIAKIGTERVQKTIERFGLTQTDITNNKTSLLDMYILLKKIYKGEIANPSLTHELLGFLKDTDIEDRIPKLLPKDAIVYHKTGDAVGSIHDVGIVKQDNVAFFVGVATADVGDQEKETKNTIAKIAKKIFDFEVDRR